MGGILTRGNREALITSPCNAKPNYWRRTPIPFFPIVNKWDPSKSVKEHTYIEEKEAPKRHVSNNKKTTKV